ncbi:MAG: hypothetical protein ACJAQT_004479, partial [Akkermansiaceae bacterium]
MPDMFFLFKKLNITRFANPEDSKSLPPNPATPPSVFGLHLFSSARTAPD